MADKKMPKDDGWDIFETALDDPRLRGAAAVGALGLVLPKVGSMLARSGTRLSRREVEQLSRELIRPGQAAFGTAGAVSGYAAGEKKARRK